MAAKARAKATKSTGKTAKKTKAVRGSRTGRPIMVLFDLLGRRWTLRLLWELRAGPMTFRQLRDAMEDVSPSVLNERLRALRDANLVDRSEGEGYVLTDQAHALSEHLLPLDGWARAWARSLR